MTKSSRKDVSDMGVDLGYAHKKKLQTALLPTELRRPVIVVILILKLSIHVYIES